MKKYSVGDILLLSELLGYKTKKVRKNEYHLYFKDKLVFTVWKNVSENWKNEIESSFKRRGYKNLSSDMAVYYLNNK